MLGKTAFVLAFLLAFASQAGAADKYAVASGNWNAGSGVWASGGGTSCASAANSGAPGSGDDAIICAGVTVTLDISPGIRQLFVNSGGVLQDDGVASRTLTMSGGAGDDLTNDGTIDLQGANPSTLAITANSAWGGTGTWNLGAISLANRTVSFGNAMTLNLSAATPITFTTGGVSDPAPTLITWNFNGTVAQTLPTSLDVRYGRITINNTAGVTLGVGLNVINLSDNVVVQTGILNDGGFTIAGQAGKTFQIDSGATFRTTQATLGVSGFGTYSFGTNPNCGTFEYNGTAAQAIGTTFSYGNLTLSNTGAKTIGAVMTVNCAFTMSSGVNFTAGSFTHNIAGDFINNGASFTNTGSTFNLNGSIAQAIGGSSSTTFNNLTVANAAGVTINNDTTVAGTAAGALTLGSSIVTTNTKILDLTGNCTTATVSRTTGWVNGLLKKTVPTGSNLSCTYEVGDASTYRPIDITYASVSGAGSVTGTVTPSSGDHPQNATSGIDPLKGVNRYWTLTNSGLTFTNYSVTFNFVAGDVDAAATSPTDLRPLFEIERYDGANWQTTTEGAATSTSTTATGVTGMSEFSVGRKKADHFTVSVPGTGDTCNPSSVTITAKDKNDVTMTDYTGTINITTSTSDGDWSGGNGTVTNGTADDGAASYASVSADGGVMTLSLSNIKVNSDVTVTAVDSARSSSSTTSAAIPYRGNFFDIASDTIQVAGKNQSMGATRKQGASCNVTLTEYAGSKGLKAWYTADGSHPSGALAPSISGMVSPPLGTSVPGSDNLTLSFTSGVASFTLTTTDVGKYAINLRDSAAGNSDGSSSTITTRPFALVAHTIKQGTTNNPGGTASAGSKFIAAADSFQATVGAYLWSATADSNNDGLPDGSATLAQITAIGSTPAYRESTTLSAASPFTPAAGTLGTLSNGLQSGACPTGAPNCFTSGVATPTNLSYNDVGSFTMSVAANFLGVDLANDGGTSRIVVFDNSATPLRNAVIGRFHPDHFTLTASSLTPFCSGFTYMGQNALAYTFNVEARNFSDVKTNNYGTGYTTGTVSVLAENGDNGTDLSSRLGAPSGSWSSGAFSSTTSATFSRPASPDGPFDLLQIGVQVTDSDGPVLVGRDMNPATAGACGGSCTAVAIGTTKARFGRVRILPGTGVANLRMAATIRTEYWNGSGFVANTDDSCTTLSQENLALGSYAKNLNACETRAFNGGAAAPPQTISFTGGLGTMYLAAPGVANNGSVVLTANLGAAAAGNYCQTVGGGESAVAAASKGYLQGAWNGVATYDQNPLARFSFGVYGAQPRQLIFMRENY